MNSKLTKTAAIISLIIGAMSIIAGGQVVFLGKVMDYYVIDWLPIYNIIVGFISVFFTAIVIWKDSKFAMPAAIATFATHTMVMLVLQTAYRDMVAPDSIKATIVRMVLWVMILVLMSTQSYKRKTEQS